MKKLSSLLDSAIAITAVTFLGYIAAYFYQLGYYSFYRIPGEFIKVDAEKIIACTVTVSLLVIVLYQILHLLPQGKTTRSTPTKTHLDSFLHITSIIIIKLSGIFLLPGILFFGIDSLQKPYSIFIALVPLLFSLEFLLIRPYIHNRKKGVKFALLALSSKGTNKKINFKTINKVTIVLSIAAVIAIIVIFYLSGRIIAGNKEDYHIINKGEDEYVMVATSGDKIIAVGLDRKNEKTTPQIIVFSEDEMQLRSEHLFLLNQPPKTNITVTIIPRFNEALDVVRRVVSGLPEKIVSPFKCD